ncbi:MAG: AAA family ATPase [Planctomycetaceae bacterium]|nr:MAG: AAA family ATPase [Planctomycetaceae bacterium]
MSWGEIQGHDQVIDQFRRAIANNRLASTFLFIGPPGIGKRTFAQRLAKAMLCESSRSDVLEPCGHCSACQQVDARTHPDLEVVSKPKDRSYIPLELFIGDREHRMREGLCFRMSMKSFRGGYKIGIIEDADFLRQEGANCLLKTLEEPPPRTLLILIGTSEQRQLPTIRSRSQIIRFRPLDESLVADLLVEHDMIGDPRQAARLAALSGGSLQRALELDDAALDEFRQSLLDQLSLADWDSVKFSKELAAFVDGAGKDPSAKRERIVQVMGMAGEFYRQMMRSCSGVPIEGDRPMHQAVAAALNAWPGDAETAAACLERCLDAQNQVQANANQATLLECWLDDLATTTRSASPLAPSWL